MVSLVFLAVVASVPTSIAIDAGTFGACGGTVLAEARDAQPPSVVRQPLDNTNSASLALESDEVWRVSLEGSRCWIAPFDVPSAGGASRDRIVVRGWPKRQLTGKWNLAEDVKAPDELHVTVQSPAGVDDVSSLRFKASYACTVDGVQWRCGVPAAVLDLRLEANGFVPVYAWQQDLREKDTHLGAVKLERGASVAGWIIPVDGSAAAAAEVELRPAAVAETAALTQRLDAQKLESKATERGFFQLRGVPIGTYTLTVKAEGASAARWEDLRIIEPREYVIDEIALHALGRVDVVIDPPVTPRNGLWEVQFRSLGKREPAAEAFRKQPVNDEGRWSKSGLEHGLYVLSIYNDEGARVAERELDMRGGTETVHILIGDVPVSGRVRLGSKGLRSKLRFESGGANVQMESDASGAFSGSLPNEGMWQVQVSLADALQRVRVQRVKVERNEGEETARVEIELPGGYIEGTVVNASGKVVPAAEVIVRRGTALVTNGATDDSGRFMLVGLEEGTVAIVATRDGLDSDEVAYTVTDTGAPVTLTLRELTTVRGRLVNHDGSPVTGAVIRYFYGTRMHAPAVSGPTGQFAMKVPRGLSALPVVVIATGLPVKLEEIAVPSDGRTLEIRWGGPGGILVVNPGGASQLPVLQRGAVMMNLRALFAPHDFGPPRELREDGFHLQLEAGPYAVCVTERCLRATVSPGGLTLADFRSMNTSN